MKPHLVVDPNTSFYLSSLNLSYNQFSSFRRCLLQSFLFKFYIYVCLKLREGSIDPKHMSIAYPYLRVVSRGQQTIPERPDSQKVVGTSMPHRSAYLHTTGEAKYLDDIPSLHGTLRGALVLSTQANARITNIGQSLFSSFSQQSETFFSLKDISAASRLSGFVSFVNHTDVPGRNDTGDIVHDEEVFVSSIAPCVGAIIGLVVCESEQVAQIAASLIHIEYELLTPTIFTIDEAIKHGSYLGEERYLRKGDAMKALARAEHTLEGTVLIGGQEHFYLETNCCMAVPSDDDQELTLYSSTQSPSKTQELTAMALGRDASRIVCRVKRMGGGFGGKETRS